MLTTFMALVSICCMFTPTMSATSQHRTQAMASSATARDQYQWPFAWSSIWNLPLSVDATYVPATLNASNLYVDTEDISVDPSDPERTLSSPLYSAQVHSSSTLTGDGSWNNCATFLGTDNQTVYQGQPLVLPAGGNPTYHYAWNGISIKGDGTTGCHGGSGLSGLGGDIRVGEMTSTQPMRHALKIGLDCINSCDPATGHVWPATTQDWGYDRAGDVNKYGGINPHVAPGALLVIPTGTDLSWITSPHALKIAHALQTYGAYNVDNTAWSGADSFAVQQGAMAQFPDSGCGYSSTGVGDDSSCSFYSQLKTLIGRLQVVTNNSAATPGGGAIGSARIATYAPMFNDGTGTPPESVLVNGNVSPTTSTLSTSASPSASGQAVTLTAAVVPASGSVTPTGTMTFLEGSAVLGTGELGGAGLTSLTISNFSVGIHDITATYGGDAAFAVSTTPSLRQTVLVALMATVHNPSFEIGIYPWALNSQRSGTGTLAQDCSTGKSGSCSANITVTAADRQHFWNVQMTQDNLALTRNQTYIVSYYAKSSANRRINSAVQQTGSPWTVYGDSGSVAITRDWTFHSFSFTAPPNATSASVRFNVAQSNGSVWIDGVSFSAG
jgi:Carbohydrate binding domain/Bacterial Ig-like domain (group 3)